MPALPPYIPTKDANLANWLTNFTTLITATPSAFGLTPTDAANIDASVALFSNAYAPITSPSTKTAQAVSNKNTAKVTTLAQIRPYAQNISLNPGVSSANKIAVGVNPRTSTPSPITPPVSTPILLLQSLQNLAATLRYRDSASSPSVKGKPYGVKQCRIFGMVSATSVTNPASMPLVATATKSPFVLGFPSAEAGMQFYCAAVWAIQTGGTSPWSPIINFTIPAAG
jgi:hypothetical protein